MALHRTDESEHGRGSWLDSLVRPAWFAPLLVGLSGAVSLWYLKYRFEGSDAGALLTSALKILRGAVFYRDIDAYPLPGAAYLAALAMRLFGERITVARSVAAVLFCITMLSLYTTALRLMGRRSAALFGLSLLSFKFIGWPTFTALTYWDTAFSFGCAAIALLSGHRFRGPTLQLAAGGFCVALALSAKQNVGLYLGFAMGMLLFYPGVVGAPRADPRQRWTELATFGLGVLTAAGPMLAYFAAQGVLGQLLFSGLVRPFTSYLPTSGISYLPPLWWWKLGTLQELPGFEYWSEPLWTMLRQKQLPGVAYYGLIWTAGEVFMRLVYTAMPIVFVAGLVRWNRARQRGLAAEDTPLFTTLALAAAVVLTAFPRAGFTHVISVYPVVVLLGFALWDQIGEPGSARRLFARRLRAAGVAALLGVCALLTVLQQSVLTHHMKLERADLMVAPDRAYIGSVVDFLSHELGPDDRLFVYGHEAYFYFLTGYTYPWPFSQLYPGQTGNDKGKALVELLKRERPTYVVKGYLHFEGIPILPNYAPVLDRWLRVHYVYDWRVRDRYHRAGGWPQAGFIAMLRPRRIGETGMFE